MRVWYVDVVKGAADSLWYVEGYEFDYSYSLEGGLSEISDYAGPFRTRAEAAKEFDGIVRSGYAHPMTPHIRSRMGFAHA